MTFRMVYSVLLGLLFFTGSAFCQATLVNPGEDATSISVGLTTGSSDYTSATAALVVTTSGRFDMAFSGSLVLGVMVVE
jgi:hypothetical protein